MGVMENNFVKLILTEI